MVPLVFKTSLGAVRPPEGSTPSLLRQSQIGVKRVDEKRTRSDSNELDRTLGTLIDRVMKCKVRWPSEGLSREDSFMREARWANPGSKSLPSHSIGDHDFFRRHQRASAVVPMNIDELTALAFEFIDYRSFRGRLDGSVDIQNLLGSPAPNPL